MEPILDDYDFKTSFFIVCDYTAQKKEIACNNIKTLEHKRLILYSIREWLDYKIRNYFNKNISGDFYGKEIRDNLFNQVIIFINTQNEFTFKDSVGNELIKINTIPIIIYHDINTEISVSISLEFLEREQKYTHDGFKVHTFVDGI